MFVVGTLDLPEPAWTALLARPADPAALTAWKGALQPGTASLTGQPLSRLVEVMTGQGTDFLEIRPTASDGLVHVELTGWLSKDSFLDLGPHLVELMMHAEGAGELWLLEEQVMWTPQDPQLCYRVTAAGIEHPSREAQGAVTATDHFGRLMARVENELGEDFID